jgi:hypothetical protein
MPVQVATIVHLVRTEVARRILKAALTMQSAHRGDLSVGNPAPHRNPAPRGDYPRFRTGSGRANVALTTTNLAEIARNLSVGVGYRPAGMHLLWLNRKGWKGLMDTYDRVKGQIQAILQGTP